MRSAARVRGAAAGRCGLTRPFLSPFHGTGAQRAHAHLVLQACRFHLQEGCIHSWDPQGQCLLIFRNIMQPRHGAGRTSPSGGPCAWPLPAGAGGTMILTARSRHGRGRQQRGCMWEQLGCKRAAGFMTGQMHCLQIQDMQGPSRWDRAPHWQAVQFPAAVWVACKPTLLYAVLRPQACIWQQGSAAHSAATASAGCASAASNSWRFRRRVSRDVSPPSTATSASLQATGEGSECRGHMLLSGRHPSCKAAATGEVSQAVQEHTSSSTRRQHSQAPLLRAL